MLWILLTIYILWALFAVSKQVEEYNRENDRYKLTLVFVLNLFICPIAIAIAVYKQRKYLKDAFYIIKKG